MSHHSIIRNKRQSRYTLLFLFKLSTLRRRQIIPFSVPESASYCCDVLLGSCAKSVLLSTDQTGCDIFLVHNAVVILASTGVSQPAAVGKEYKLSASHSLNALNTLGSPHCSPASRDNQQKNSSMKQRAALVSKLAGVCRWRESFQVHSNHRPHARLSTDNNLRNCPESREKRYTTKS